MGTRALMASAPHPHIKALGTLVFFRAILFAALFATGADSTLLLRSEKRNVVVQALETGFEMDGRVDDVFVLDKQPPPTMCEKRLIKVG